MNVYILAYTSRSSIVEYILDYLVFAEYIHIHECLDEYMSVYTHIDCMVLDYIAYVSIYRSGGTRETVTCITAVLQV